MSQTPLSGPELAAAMKIGTRVVRGADWNLMYGNQDGSPPGAGTVTEELSSDGWIKVRWDWNAKLNYYGRTYRMGFKGKYDLQIADSLPVQKQNSFSDSVEQNDNTVTEAFVEDSLSSHELKCFDRPFRCPNCSDVVARRVWFDHECQTVRIKDNTVTVKCSYCKEAFVEDCLSSHELKCLDRPFPCPTCSDVVARRVWFDHECQTVRIKDNTVTVKCSYCKEAFVEDCLSSHELKCLDRPFRCPTCSDVFARRVWFDHECQTVRIKDNTVTVKCSYCKEAFVEDCLSSHELKCLDRPFRCLTCSDVFARRVWFDHECQTVRIKDNTVTVKCSYCKEAFVEDCLSSHELKCLDRPFRCLTCSDVFARRVWFDHECQTVRIKDNTVTVKCSYCKEAFVEDCLSSHELKCLDRPFRCPTCSDVVARRVWFDHECQTVRIKATEKLVDVMTDIIQKEELSDITIKVKDKEFKLHRIILAGRNPYFNSMFKTEMKEKTTGIVSIDDCDPDIFHSFIYFVYTGKTRELSEENVCALYEVADKYQEDQLKAECLCFMMNKISVDSCCDFLVLALRYDEKELLKSVTEFFCRKTYEIIKSVKWQTFIQEYPIQANELFIKFFEFNAK